MNTIGEPTRKDRLDALREELRQRFPGAHLRPPRAVVRTGVEVLDAWRIQEGTITEIVSLSPSMGSGTLIGAILDAAGDERAHFVALIDALDAFDPGRYGPRVLRKMLWVRCRTMDDVPVVTDWLVRDGNFPLVLLDLQLALYRDLTRLPANVWTRLSLVAEQSRVAVLAFTPIKCIPPAALRLQPGTPALHSAMEKNQALFSSRDQPSPAELQGLPDLPELHEFSPVLPEKPSQRA